MDTIYIFLIVILIVAAIAFVVVYFVFIRPMWALANMAKAASNKPKTSTSDSIENEILLK